MSKNDEDSALPSSARALEKQTLESLKMKLIDLVKKGDIREAMKELYNTPDDIINKIPLIRSTTSSESEEVSVFDTLMKEGLSSAANMFGMECKLCGYADDFQYVWPSDHMKNSSL